MEVDADNITGDEAAESESRAPLTVVKGVTGSNGGGVGGTEHRVRLR